MSFDHIALIYNPNSTGDAPAVAEKLSRDIEALGLKPVLTPTDHAGHAEELAYGLAQGHASPLIISVSGDGGYHEVINGVMRAKQADRSSRAVVAVAAAGNANDHRRVMRNRPLIEAIRDGRPTSIDLLKLTLTTPESQLVRYAHSYIGFGVTPEIAVELNRHALTWRKEISIILKSFMRYKSFTVIHDDSPREIDSLIFANINEMAKVMKFKDKPNLQDNRFEVIEFRHEGRLRLLYHLLRAVLFGLPHVPSYKRYEFRTDAPQSVQSDGEIEPLTTAAEVKVESAPQAIDSLF